MVRYDGVLLVSFGGPEGPDDVWPFLENVTRGRDVPRERLAEVAEHYLHFGGVSPLNGQNRALLAALREVLDLPVYWGNRNWHPLLPETVAQMARDGVSAALAFVTSAYSSYSSCRQYLDAIELARRVVGPSAPAVVRLPPFFDRPGFVRPFVHSTLAALAQVPEEAHLLFTAHSVPLAMAKESGPAGGAYESQLRQVAARVVDGLGRLGEGRPWQLVWQSRSGPPEVPWLVPDVLDALRKAHAAGAPGVVLVPIGFTSDHIEVVYDLDVQARDLATTLRLPLARAGTPGTDREFVAMVRDLVAEAAAAPQPGSQSGPRSGSRSDPQSGSRSVYCTPACCGGTRL